MITIQNKEKCCGCTACASICPRKCIGMVADDEGFLYPQVDTKKCVDCGLCEKVCPQLSGYKKSHVKKAYVVRHKNDAVVSSSTSGGAFTAFAECVLEQGGSVFGVAYDENFQVAHIEVRGEVEQLAGFRGSKYVQSRLDNTFSSVKDRLENGETVLFSGTSCQIAGLSNYLRKDYENLLTIEVICHGTPSPLLWKKYLEYQQKKYNSTVRSAVFRKKTYGYHSGTMELVFANGKRYTGSARVDYMLKSFFSEISSRPSCYTCLCKGIERPADISIYDCWHAKELVPGLLDDDKGYTNILINTDKGQRLLQNTVAQLNWEPVYVERAIALDGVMVIRYPRKHPARERYYQLLRTVGLVQTVDQLIPVSQKDRIIEGSKGFLYKTGLFPVIKKLVKK